MIEVTLRNAVECLRERVSELRGRRPGVDLLQLRDGIEQTPVDLVVAQHGRVILRQRAAAAPGRSGQRSGEAPAPRKSANSACVMP